MKQSCPICRSPVEPNVRYPRYVCSRCAARATSHDGRLLEFGNVDFTGGFVAHYADTHESYPSHQCLIDGVQCYADEARFGGIVIEASMFNELVAAIEEAEKSFNQDELAFLALTSKIELPFRDRIAFSLAARAINSGGRIAREYKRADIAWLTGSSPKAIIELKACYTFDLITQPDIYVGHVLADLMKASKCGGMNCGCFAILLAAHPRGPIRHDLYDTIKYAAKINVAIKKNGSSELVKERGENEVDLRLKRFASVHKFCWRLGSYLDVGVDLVGWLVEARNDHEITVKGQPGIVVLRDASKMQ